MVLSLNSSIHDNHIFQQWLTSGYPVWYPTLQSLLDHVFQSLIYVLEGKSNDSGFAGSYSESPSCSFQTCDSSSISFSTVMIGSVRSFVSPTTPKWKWWIINWSFQLPCIVRFSISIYKNFIFWRNTNYKEPWYPLFHFFSPWLESFCRLTNRELMYLKPSQIW